MVLKCLIYLYNKQTKCLGQFQCKKREEKMQMPVKATWEYYCPSGKTVKASGQFCNIYIPLIIFIKPIYDEMVLKCLIYLFTNQKYHLEQF